MKYIINDKSYIFDEEDLESSLIGMGEEGSCYHIRNYRDNFVMKIFHPNSRKEPLKEETCKVLKEIDTEKFLLPRDLVYDEEGKYVGFINDYKTYKKPSIRNLKIGRVIDEFYELEKDVNILSNNHVYIDDLDYGNTVFSNGIYICDPGRFSLAETDEQKRFAKYYNRKRITEYEIEEIIFMLFKLSSREQDRFREKFSNIDEFLSDILSFMVPDMEENAKTYFKEVVRR